MQNICEYGCGQEGKFQFKNGKWCCSDDCHRCIEFKKRYEGKNNPSYGVSPSKETREKQRIKLKGKKKGPISEVSKRKISLANKGKIRTNETRRKMSISSKKRKRKPHSLESKRKISDNHADVNGENNPNWKGGKSYEPYCEIWADNEYKEYIRQRDNYKCQNPECYNKEYKRSLDIHHIDYDKKNCVKNNLITICRSCNSRANFNRQYWTKIYQDIIKENINDNFYR